MQAEQVCAVVVSFHPEADVAENLRALGGQVQGLVVIDNGSTASELSMLEGAIAEFAESALAEVIRNGTNLGIAAALNEGVRWAARRGFEWVMLFDQDSAVTPGYVAAMMAAFARSEFGERLAILVPRYVDRRSGSTLEAPRGKTKGLEAATTSGSLMQVKVFEKAGWFAEELFIDGVDYEYSLRVRRLGYGIEECAGAELLHSPGTPTWHTVLGKRFQVANYSPVRRYYQERNKVWVTRRYWRDFLPFCLGQFGISLKDLVKILVAETDKGRKCRFFFRGIWDGWGERMGKLE
jgi:rhamnosyltransferase